MTKKLRRRITYKCTCGGEGWITGGKRLVDGMRKRTIRCQRCKRTWTVDSYRLPKASSTARHNGLWMLWRGYWYSPRKQARIREVSDG